MKKSLSVGISCHKGVQYGLFIGQKAWFWAGASSRKKSNYGKVMQLLFVQPFLSVRLNFHKSKLFITNIKGNFYERVQELDAREKTLIKICVGLFYLQMHFIMCILCKQDVGRSVKLGVLMNAEHHAQPDKLWSMLTPCFLLFQWDFVLLPWI